MGSGDTLRAMSSGRERSRRADVVILTALALEYQAALQLEAGAWEGSQWEEEQGFEGLPVAFRTFKGKGGRPLRVVLAQAGDMGAVPATQALVTLVQAYRPRCVAMCGVCAGRRDKTNLGDVIAAERLFFHDTGKQLPDEVQQDLRTYNLREDWKVALERFDFVSRFQSETWWRERPVPFEWQENWVLARLKEGIAEPWKHPECHRSCPQWEQVIEALWASGDVQEGTCELTDKGRKRILPVLIKYKGELPALTPEGSVLPFKVHVAPMGSGSRVIEDESVWSFISPHMRKTLGLEMEAAALGSLAHAQRSLRLDALVLKGVMDFADAGRDDHFKSFSARASAECLLVFIREHVEVEVIPGIDDLLVPGTERALPANPPPSALLNARYEVIPFHEGGRETVLEELDRWCEEEPAVAVRLLHADGGVGKTRLAIEWIQRRRSEGWAAGFLSKDVTDDWFDRLWNIGHPMLVVIDYAESRSDLLGALMRLYRYRQQADAGKLRRVRLLLLARGAGDWWQSLLQSDAALGAWLSLTPPYELAPLAVSETEREKVFHEAAARFAEKLGKKSIRRAPPLFADERFTRVLYLHMAALASVEELPFAANTLLEVILEHEEHFWETRVRQGEIALSRQRAIARQVVAAATLRGGFANFSEARLVAGRLLDRPLTSDDEELLLLLQRIYQDTDENPGLFLPALEPDLLGEGMVLRVLSPSLQGDRPPADWTSRLFPQDAPAHEVRTALELLGRASASWPDLVRPWLSQLLTPLPLRAPLALEAANAVGLRTGLSVLGDVLAERLEEEGDLHLALELWRPNARWTVSLRRVDEWVARKLLQSLTVGTAEEKRQARAYLLVERGTALLSLGRHEEALEAMREALEIRHALAQDNPTALQSELAVGLHALGNALRESGRFEEALSVEDEAITIFRSLSAHDAKLSQGGLAGSLVNKSAVLLHLKRNQDALAAAEEAIKLLRPLDQSDPETFRDELSTGLLNLSIALVNLGRANDALGIIIEAVTLRRALARKNPDVYQPNLALLLLNMGIAFDAVGRHEEAVSAAKEAVGLYRLFAQRDPKAFQVKFTQSLSNLGVWLFELNRHEEAIAVIGEAVTSLRSLSQSDAATHSLSLARNLFSLGFNLNQLSRHEEAVPFLREAVEHLRPLAQRSPEALRYELSIYLNELGETLRELGRNEEALAAMEEAITAVWPVFESNPLKNAGHTAGLLLQALELRNLLHQPSLYLATRFDIFDRLVTRPSGQDEE